MKKTKFLSILLVLLVHIQNIEGYSLRPIPWVTHEAFLFLEQFMKTHPGAYILEFGAGASTIWFAKRTSHLTSIEHSAEWFNEVRKIIDTTPECAKVKLILHPRPYYTLCDTFPDEYFDLILVDGRNRSGCIKHAIRTLKQGGILMLDNAERPFYQKAINLLKGWKSVSTTQSEPDSCGFTYPNWTTNWYIKPLKEIT